MLWLTVTGHRDGHGRDVKQMVTLSQEAGEMNAGPQQTFSFLFSPGPQTMGRGG